MVCQNWFDHVKEKKFIGQENVFLIMILRNTGPALGLGLRPLIYIKPKALYQKEASKSKDYKA